MIRLNAFTVSWMVGAIAFAATHLRAGENSAVEQPSGNHRDGPVDEPRASDEVFDHWGPMVNGLRMRLIAVRKAYVAGEPIDLILLLQNASEKKIVLPAIRLMPAISYDDSHPYGKNHKYNTMIEFEFDGCILWEMQKSMGVMREDIALEPDDVHVATVQLPSDRKHYKVEELERRRRRNGGGLSRHRAQFSLSREPGRYVFFARYHPDGLAKTAFPTLTRVDNGLNWKGKVLRSNRVELKIVASERPESVEEATSDGES